MITSVKCVFNIFICFLLICYTLYITNPRIEDDIEYLRIVFNSKIYRTVVLLIITFTSIGLEIGEPKIGGNHILALFVAISYILSINKLKV